MNDGRYGCQGACSSDGRDVRRESDGDDDNDNWTIGNNDAKCRGTAKEWPTHVSWPTNIVTMTAQVTCIESSKTRRLLRNIDVPVRRIDGRMVSICICSINTYRYHLTKAPNFTCSRQPNIRICKIYVYTYIRVFTYFGVLLFA